MTKMAPDFSFRKEHFLCLKCNEKNIHQCWALECGYSQLINHKPLSICWSQSLAWESAVFLTYLLCSHLSAQAQASQAMPRWPPGPKLPPPYSVAAQSLSRVWLLNLMNCSTASLSSTLPLRGVYNLVGTRLLRSTYVYLWLETAMWDLKETLKHHSLSEVLEDSLLKFEHLTAHTPPWAPLSSIHCPQLCCILPRVLTTFRHAL